MRRYYTPRLDRDLVTRLFHAAKSRQIPMTRLASTLVREGLARFNESTGSANPAAGEDPPASDPTGR